MDTPEVTDPSLLDNLRRIELDVTEGEDALRAKVEAAASIWGRIDVLVNNAGQGLVGLSEEGGSTLFRRTFDVNVFGLVDMTTVTLPYLRASKGCVVNIGSRSAWKTEIVGVGPYSASKAAVHALSETLAVELAPFGVRVMLVAPGAFRTEGIHAKPFYEDRPLAEYDETRKATAKRFASISGTQRGDPAKAMEVLVDIIRQEGVAKDKPWPRHLILGEDAINDVRAKSTSIIKELEEWEVIGKAVSF
ncbi:short-chain dehydrogenase/reductase SDR [Coprinopsis cinerea okayama7|uniref:Short-chain dehydrogenase/reductase SDR n=1 Tax=Coprinopsis cinerea (strain Okayama-7 / 130 / ATCC MYA-4618 / FGSC 9003) TaxID=240176 RepID=A8NNQ1_COPC7|nr:short-chain dehydrogenase/reductase SDR [Coprinopsis cinerea okayama7\|eukprot:XP_001835172.2 short-chain dehydrogenase/reductase SDR [Coprinopsis cinerea okayama7\